METIYLELLRWVYAAPMLSGFIAAAVCLVLIRGMVLAWR